METDITICVVGAAGRMGRSIIRCLLDHAVTGCRLAGALEVPESLAIGQDAGTLAGAATTGVLVTADLEEALADSDVVIDFTYPAATCAQAATIAESGTAWVVGTTGFEPEQMEPVLAAAQKIPLVMAPNMSVGVNLLLKLVEDAASVLRGRGYDIEVVERHHRRKKDAPSGTALALAAAAARGAGWNLPEVVRNGRAGIEEAGRPEKEIALHAIRGGDFVGDHTVLFAAEGESIEISHRATNRDTFAIGALRAAVWAAGRHPGLYHMRDVLDL